MSLAQIGEFAFVLLSRSSNLHLVEVSMAIIAVSHGIAQAEKYMLLRLSQCKMSWDNSVF